MKPTEAAKLDDEDIEITPELIHAISMSILYKLFDRPDPHPLCHEEWWAMCCSTAQYVAIAAPRNHAKAQALDSQVLTPSGWSTIGALNIGDSIIGGDGTEKKVTQIHPIQEMDLYRVETSDGKSTLCNLGHLWNIEIPSNKSGIQTKTLEDILSNWKTDRVNHTTGKSYTEFRYRIPAVKPIQYDTKQFLIDPYTLGVWLGDGTSANGDITTADPEILNYITYDVSKKSAKYIYKLEGLYKDLKLCDLINNKHIPNNYLFGDVEQRLALLQGLLDTDGTCHKTHGQVSFCNTNKNLVDGVVELVRSLGGIASLSSGIGKCNGKTGKQYWKVTCKLGNDLCPFKLARKAELWSNSTTLYSYITKIEKEVRTLGRCISVQDETYITDDYLLTHNSTAVTFCYVLVMLMLRKADYIIIVSNTAEQSSGFVAMISRAIRELPELREFGIRTKLIKSNETEIIGEFVDSKRFCVRIRGVGSQVRGLLFEGRRPNLIVCDDLEDKETVMSDEARRKAYSTFLADIVPAISTYGLIRVVGTILHEDSILSNLLDDPLWVTGRYAAHNEDFSEILWPERFTEAKLRALQASWVANGRADEYANEYLSLALSSTHSYFKPTDIRLFDMAELGRTHLVKYIIIDPASSDSSANDFAALGVIGVSHSGAVYILDAALEKLESPDLIDLIFALEKEYKPREIIMESGALKNVLGPFIYKKMRMDRQYFVLSGIAPSRSKTARATSIRAMMRAGKVFLNKDIECLPAWQQQILQFPRGKNDDAVDVMAYIGLYLESIVDGKSDESQDEEYERSDLMDYLDASGYADRDPETGY